jgi:hypothetical protein
MLAEIQTFTAILHQQGTHAALEYLNSRTPHRYTGLFRFDGDTLRNQVLFDRNQADVPQGEDVPLALTYCSLVERSQAFLEITDAAADPRAQPIATPVLSYCGVIVRDAQGKPYGSLCHYDMQRCQERTTDAPLLAAAAALLYQHFHGTSAHGT